MNKFQHDYLIFDEFGEKEILCMACAAPIKSRSEIKSALTASGIIREMARHADYREIPAITSNGNVVFVMVCDNCKFVDIGEAEASLITKQIYNARKAQLEFKGLSGDVIQAILDKFDYPVIRKAETHEVVSALRKT